MSEFPTRIVVCDVPVFFATTEGQTRRIAERIASGLRAHGLISRSIDITSPDAMAIDWNAVRGAVVGASLHMQRHQPAATAFVQANVARLNRIPSTFFSVSLSAASVNVEEVNAAARIAKALPLAHGWTADIVLSLGGRLAYTQYGFFKRLVMKRIARKEGAPTDTRRDHEFTNWENVDLLARDFAGMVRARQVTSAVA